MLLVDTEREYNFQPTTPTLTQTDTQTLDIDNKIIQIAAGSRQLSSQLSQNLSSFWRLFGPPNNDLLDYEKHRQFK